jgi:hypothetical protein
MASHEERFKASTSFAGRINLAERAWIGIHDHKQLGMDGLRVAFSFFRYAVDINEARDPS